MIYNFDEVGARAACLSVRNILSCRTKKYFIYTFGCQQNEADSEKIRAMAEMMGYSAAESADDADLVVLNTCAIRAHAEMKALSLLGSFKARKKADPDFILGVVGCMAAEEGVKESLKNKFHYVSFTLEPNMLHKMPEAILRYLTDRKRSFVFGEDKGDIVEGVEPIRSYSHKAFVSVMYGCNNFCSYCIVPYVRGRERSRDSAEIIKECQALIDSGVREITLLGQNVNSYKSDMDFPDLLSMIAKIEGDFIIRFMTSHPKDTSDKLIEVMAKYKGKIGAYFHLPLQSGSDAVLKKMNRTYDSRRFLSIVEKLREKIPDISLSTDVIVGFPGEREQDFEDTLSVLSKARFDSVFAFMYSAREGTPAARMEGQIPDEVKSDRLSRLFALQDPISYENALPYLNKSVRVLTDSFDIRDGKRIYNGRTFSNKLVHFTAEEAALGEFVNVKINKAGGFDLIGAEDK